MKARTERAASIDRGLADRNLPRARRRRATHFERAIRDSA
jgi:hypothetical protein